jgi:hypothetical protein
MKTDYKNMGKWETEKAIFLQKTAVDLGMDLTGYGMVAVNPNSGYTYLWLEDYQFTLYMPISCELKKTDVWALWSDPEDGEETEMQLKNKTTLNDLNEFVDSCETDAKGDKSRV